MSEFHTELQAFSAAIEQELVEGSLNFPTVLDLSLRIRQVADDPDSSVEEMARLIRIEPVLSARVIRMANSVIFNLSGRSVRSVTDAIPMIGISNVRVTALVVAMDQLAQEHRSKAMRDLAQRVWQHSIDVAAWAYAIARHLRVGEPDTAMLAGLMAHIGHFFLIARVGQYPAIAADLDAFFEIADFWGAALTRSILESMELPGDVLDALDSSDPYAGGWPPRTLDEVIQIAGLAAESDGSFDPRKRDARQKVLEQARSALEAPKLDDLLSAALGERDELLAVLKG